MTPAPADVSLADLAGPTAHQVLARLRAEDPVAWVPALDAWLVTDRATVVVALRDPDTLTVDDPRFTTGQVVGPSMLSTDGAPHRRHRAPFIAPFRTPVVDGRDRGRAVEAARARVESFRAAGRAELRSALAHPLALTVIATSLGLDPAIEPEIGRWYRDIVAGVEALSAGRRPDPATDAAVQALGRAMRSGLADQAGAAVGPGAPDPGRGPASVLAHLAADPGDLTDDEQIANLAVVLFGAIETGEGMTANALLHLLSDPELTDRVRRDRSLVAPVIEESLRLEPAAAVVDRYATADRRLGPRGADVRAGQKVILSLAGANRDPDAFERPDHLVLDRPPLPSHLAFATGPHACIGAQLARIETAAAIEAALDLLPDLDLDAAASTPATGLVFRKPERVMTHWRP